jgi:hypothetical protein
MGQPISPGSVAAGRESRSPLIPILVASCVAVLIVTAGVVAAITLGGEDEPVASPETTTSTTVTTTTAPTTSVPTTTVAPPPQVVVVVPAPAPGPSGGAIGSSGAPADPPSGDEGLVTSPSSSRPWVAIVASIEKSRSDGFAAASNAAEATSMPGYYLDVLDSNEFAGLYDGYWVAAGAAMSSRQEAVNACVASGLGVTGDGAGGQCYPANVFNLDR